MITSKEEVTAILKELLNECLEGANQENSFTVTDVDLVNRKFSVDFDIVIIDSDQYIGFSGY